MDATPCSFPGCSKPAKARGLCHPHYQQKHVRGQKLRPIRPKAEPGVRLPGLWVTATCAEALSDLADTPYAGARKVLEGWARGEPPPTAAGGAA